MLSLTALGQEYSRVPSGTPLKWGMNGSVEVMPSALAQYYGSNDTATDNRRNLATYKTALGGNPNAIRFAALNAQCDPNGMVLNWEAVQTFGADRYEVEQSADGRNWQVVGVVPARRTDYGEASYSFNYAKNARQGFFRITATHIGGDRIVSSILESPCSPTAYLAATPNPVYSTTTIRLGSPVAAKVKMVLVDSRGSVVMSRDASLVSGTNHLPIDMAGLPRGHYTLVIAWLNGKQQTLELVKQ